MSVWGIQGSGGIFERDKRSKWFAKSILYILQCEEYFLYATWLFTPPIRKQNDLYTPIYPPCSIDTLQKPLTPLVSWLFNSPISNRKINPTLTNPPKIFNFLLPFPNDWVVFYPLNVGKLWGNCGKLHLLLKKNFSKKVIFAKNGTLSGGRKAKTFAQKCPPILTLIKSIFLKSTILSLELSVLG
jgi:hypothetical protein